MHVYELIGENTPATLYATLQSAMAVVAEWSKDHDGQVSISESNEGDTWVLKVTSSEEPDHWFRIHKTPVELSAVHDWTEWSTASLNDFKSWQLCYTRHATHATRQLPPVDGALKFNLVVHAEFVELGKHTKYEDMTCLSWFPIEGVAALEHLFRLHINFGTKTMVETVSDILAVMSYIRERG